MAEPGQRFAELLRALADRDVRFVVVGAVAAVLEGGFYDVQACNGTNRVDIHVFGNDSQVLLMACLDNLGKGASGAAVQSMNVHLGLEEGRGL